MDELLVFHSPLNSVSKFLAINYVRYCDLHSFEHITECIQIFHTMCEERCMLYMDLDQLADSCTYRTVSH